LQLFPNLAGGGVDNSILWWSFAQQKAAVSFMKRKGDRKKFLFVE
jgi:hypothetical protein